MWLIQAETLRAIEEARLAGHEAQAVSRVPDSEDSDEPRILTRAGNRARISIRGTMTRHRNILAMIFGGGNTTYSEIERALAQADADPSVEEIELALDTPGGAVDGLYDALAAVSATSTRTVARIDKASSAGFILASATDEMVATNPTSTVGSFGVAVEAMITEGRVSITNRESPDKRPDLQTEEGQAVVQDHLDSLHAIFVEEVAKNRNVAQANLTEQFGAGRVFTARDALNRGMLDRIETDSSPAAAGAPSEPTAANQRTTSMDLEKLKADHPETYRAALELGASQERDRVTAHLTMGESSGDMQTAAEAIKEGSEMTATLQAKYLAAGMRKQAMDDRSAESAEAEPAAEAGAQPGADKGEGKDFQDQVAEALTSQEIV